MEALVKSISKLLETAVKEKSVTYISRYCNRIIGFRTIIEYILQ